MLIEKVGVREKMYFDWTYLVLIVPAMIFAMWASNRVDKTFEKYQLQHSAKRITGAEAARQILNANGLRNVPIDLITGNLTDHYDPTANVVRLSQNVYNSTSTAAIGIACHEVGHALQYATSYPPVRLRMAIIPATKIGSRLSVPLIIIGILLGYLSYFFYSLGLHWNSILCSKYLLSIGYLTGRTKCQQKSFAANTGQRIAV